ncbi:MAG: LPP20 family lipoprotein [Candidatus Cloacimonas sp.]|nr:LPP20 family lipoprotein [Candidatus Cloacimonadota bacterium]
MKKSLLFLIVLCFALSVQTNLSAKRIKASKDPEWVTNPYSKYSEDRFLVAIGEGDNRGAAEAKAAANLAKIFETEVTSEEVYVERYQEIVKGSSTTHSEFSDLSQDVSITTNQTLYNVQYAENYTNKLGRTFVLAYIDRLKTGNIYTQKIEQNAERINAFIKSSENTDNYLKKYAYLNAALLIASVNKPIIEQVQIISIAHHNSLVLNYNYNDLFMLTKEVAQKVHFSLSISNDDENRLCSIISDIITGYGFVVSDKGDLKIVGDVDIESVDLKRREKFVRWNLNLNLESNDGVTLITHSQRGREGHLNYPEAVSRAYRAIESEIRLEFNKKLMKYFDNLTK